MEPKAHQMKRGDTPNRRVIMRGAGDELLNISDTVHNWRNVKP